MLETWINGVNLSLLKGSWEVLHGLHSSIHKGLGLLRMRKTFWDLGRCVLEMSMNLPLLELVQGLE